MMCWGFNSKWVLHHPPPLKQGYDDCSWQPGGKKNTLPPRWGIVTTHNKKNFHGKTGLNLLLLLQKKKPEQIFVNFVIKRRKFWNPKHSSGELLLDRISVKNNNKSNYNISHWDQAKKCALYTKLLTLAKMQDANITTNSTASEYRLQKFEMTVRVVHLKTIIFWACVSDFLNY